MSINYNLENFKNKKDLIEELNYYKSIILKKIKNGDYNSALEKVRSALVLIEEHKNSFNIEKEILDFYFTCMFLNQCRFNLFIGFTS